MGSPWTAAARIALVCAYILTCHAQSPEDFTSRCRLVVEKPFDPLKHTGGQAPYFTAPGQYNLPRELPEECVVEQAAYTLRHGSRYPEPGSFQGWVDFHSKIQNATFKAKGSLSFLPSWQLPVDDPPNETSFLSRTGAREAFTFGVELRGRYGFTKGGENLTVWAASQQRVVDTATYWLNGYLAGGHYNVSLGRIIALPDSVNFTFANSLTPSTGCPNYVNNDTAGSNYRTAMRPPITKRLNKLLEGLVLTDTDTGIMMDLCAYQTEITRQTSPFCAVFTDDEWTQFEYAMDLQYYYGSGPGNPLGATVAFPLIRTITDIFIAGPGKTTKEGTDVPPNLMMGFTHDNNIPPMVAALGLFNDSAFAPLDPSCPDPDRKFRSSYIVSFFGWIGIEKLVCRANTNAHNKDSSSALKAVRVLVNDAPVRIPGCDHGPGSTCPLEDFVAYVNKRGVLAGDFVKRCGLSNVSNATSVANFMTNMPQDATIINV